MKKFLIFLPIPFIFFLALTSIRSVSGEVGYAGPEICKGCHAVSYESYSKSIHAKKAIPGSPANKQACESCHGPGASHVEKGGVKGVDIFAFDRKVAAKEKDSKCLACHEESKHLTSWNMGKHKSAGVSCDNCHSVHAGRDKLVKQSDPDICFSCHRDIKSQANKQSHHPIKEGKVKCADCHNPHGEFGAKMVKADVVNELCYKCHSEKRGPFMWEHAPVEENCLNCHTPHGSNHSKLLAKKTPQLCQSCHDWSFHPGTPYPAQSAFTGVTPSRFFIARNCLNCHSNIHGSNGPSKRGLRFVR